MGMRSRAAASLGAVLATVAALAVLAASCGSGGTTNSKSPDPGPATTIFDGLEVQPGSRLIGAPMPACAGMDGMITTNALIGVDGDAADVYAAYVAALQRSGYELLPSACSNQPGPGPGTTSCETAEMSWLDGSGDSVWMSMVAPAADTRGFDTTLIISQTRRDPTVATTTTTLDEYWSRVAALPTTTAAPTTTLPVVDVVTDAGLRTVTDVTVPGVGDPIAPAWMDPDVGLRVEEGSTLLAPAAPLNGGSLGWTTVARITGDRTAVQQAYLDQNPMGEVTTSTRTVDGTSAWFGGWDTAGGPKLYLVSVDAGDGTALLWINVAND